MRRDAQMRRRRFGFATPTACLRKYNLEDQSMWKLTTIALATSALALGACAHSYRDATEAEHEAALSRAERDYHQAKRDCDAYSGNAEDVCKAEAKAQRAKDEAAADARYKDTPKAQYDQRMAAAEADYSVARERCDELAGDSKEVCVKEAKARLAKAKADASAGYEVGGRSDY